MTPTIGLVAAPLASYRIRFVAAKVFSFLCACWIAVFALSGTVIAEEHRYVTEQWRRVEITLTSPLNYSSPDTDVDITATFTGPNGSIITLPGFWDGGSIWKVRFAPTMVGQWSYLVTCSDPSNSGLHNQAGIVRCDAYTGSVDIYRHGFPKVSPDHRGFVYADGTPFFWLADTHWQMADYERIDACNLDNCGNQFMHLANDRIAKGFTVYQTYPDSAENDGGGNIRRVHWWAEKYTHLEPRDFREKMDVMMDYLADHGLVVALGMGVHTQATKMGADALDRFTRYMVARYASYPVVWIVGQEVDIEPLSSLPIWQGAAKTIDRYDGYNHPLGAHMTAIDDPKTFGHESWHDWFPTQGGHAGTGIRTQAHYKSYWDFVPTKPFLETEAMYEDIDCGGVTKGPKNVRISAWKAIQCGSHGYTYGVTGVWAMKWDTDVPGWDDFNVGGPWYKGMAKPGSTQMSHLKNFYTRVGIQHLVPRFADESWGNFPNRESSVISTDGSEMYVVYFYDSDLRTGALRNMRNNTPYEAKWFNPRNGEYTVISDNLVLANGTYAIPDKPDPEDWVLLVMAKSPQGPNQK